MSYRYIYIYVSYIYMMYIYICVYIYMYRYTWCVYIYTYMYTYTYDVCIHIYIYTHDIHNMLEVNSRSSNILSWPHPLLPGWSPADLTRRCGKSRSEPCSWTRRGCPGAWGLILFTSGWYTLWLFNVATEDYHSKLNHHKSSRNEPVFP